ncbi:Mavs [Columba livia]|nr:Mavs [Columba livia]
MGFAEDKVYKYIIQNLGNFKNIRVASLADSLSCLTDADRDELHTREETRGSQATAYRFYQYLRCRQGWVQDLIAALRHNNAGDLADELQHVYDSWQPRRSRSSRHCLLPSCGQHCPSRRLRRCPNAVPRAKPCSGRPIGRAAVPRPACRWPLASPARYHHYEYRPGCQGPSAGIDSSMETSTLVATLVPRDASLSCDTSLKPPVQEQYLPAGEAASGPRSVPTEEKVLPASTVPIPTVAGSFEVTSGRTTSRVSSATTIWAPCGSMEGDVEPSKPDVLLSMPGESPETAGRCPSSRGPSGHHSRSSGSLSFSSDPLLMSTDSSSSGETLSRVSLGCSAPADRENARKKEKPGASGDSSPPSSWASTSLGTHEVRVDHYPSTQLGAGSSLQDGENPLGNPPVFDSSEVVVPCVHSIRPSLSHLVGIAAISALAFLVYTRLRK